MLYTYLKIGNKDTNICLIERKLVFLQRRKTTKMQKGYTILSGENTMSESGILKVYFDTFSSKNESGVTFINNYNQSCSVDFRCCSFTGKERDKETGYGYFGARYMDHELMTMWLSVDPMADKYPSISPYAYCAWNPVKLVDPDGRDIWKLDNLGNVVDHIECNDYDCFHIVNDKGEIISSSNYYEFGTISELCLDGQSNTSFSVCGFENAKEIFEFLAGQYTKENNMPIEWAHGTVAATDSYGLGMDNSTNILTSTHEKAGVDLGVWIDNGYVISRQAHNHPSGMKRPSDIFEPNGRRHGDVPTALTFEKIFPSIENYIYIPSWGYSRYDSNGTLDSRVLNPNLPEVNINGERIK